MVKRARSLRYRELAEHFHSGLTQVAAEGLRRRERTCLHRGGSRRTPELGACAAVDVQRIRQGRAELIPAVAACAAHIKAGQEVDDEALVDPLEFLARVLIHIPEPHKHLVHFYGAYANRLRASYRAEDAAPSGQVSDSSPPRRTLSKRWAELIYRIYELDPLCCPRCGARMKILAFIIEPEVIRRILDHLDTASLQRAPPGSTPSH